SRASALTRDPDPCPATASPPSRARPVCCGKELQRLDLDDARNGLDSAGDLRRDLETAGQLHLDFRATLEQEDHADLAIAVRVGCARRRLEPFRHRLERGAIAQENAQALLQIC